MVKRTADAATAELVRQAAETLGQNLRAARLARSLTQEYMAWRAGMSLPTYKRLEAGDPTVGLHFWLQACAHVGLLELLAEATAPHRDTFGERLRGFQRTASRVRRPSRRVEDYDY